MAVEEPERMNHHPGPADWLTVPGRLLLIFTLVGGVGLFYWYFMYTAESLPSGSYPILMWIVPVALAGLVFFVGMASILERIGVRVYRKGGADH